MKGWNCGKFTNPWFFQILDVDECLDNTDSCHDDAVCTNTKGAYNCTCNNGYEGDGYNCTGKNPRCIIFPSMVWNENTFYEI